MRDDLSVPQWEASDGCKSMCAGYPASWPVSAPFKAACCCPSRPVAKYDGQRCYLGVSVRLWLPSICCTDTDAPPASIVSLLSTPTLPTANALTGSAPAATKCSARGTNRRTTPCTRKARISRKRPCRGSSSRAHRPRRAWRSSCRSGWPASKG